MLYENALSANLMVLGTSVLFVLIAMETVKLPALSVWLGSMTLAIAIRLFLWHRHRRAPQSASPRTWAFLYILATLFVGFSWGGITLFLHLTDDAMTRSIVIVLIFSLTAIAVPVLSAMRAALLAYLLPPTTALCIALLLNDLPGSRLIALGTVIFTLMMIVLGRHSHRHIVNSLQLQYRNSNLISQLHDEVMRRKKTQKQLERHEEELEEQIKSRTQELLSLNRNLEREVADRKRAEENLKHLAHHDSLTNLPNRLLLSARLEHAVEQAHRSGSRVAVLFLDLDHFKHINDSLGHAIGDDLLRLVSWRLRSSVREGDTVARLGGDEFVIVLEQLENQHVADQLAQKLMSSLREKLEIQGHSLFVGTSIGISLFPEDGLTTEELLKHADSAMYQAKHEGRNNYRFYTRELTQSAHEKLTLENSLRQALDHDELHLHYQPLISLSDGRIVGAEALIRWNHPEFGLLSPARFLDVAEESGLILPVGEWVLHSACQQMHEWRNNGIELRQMAVNVAGRQIQHESLVRKVTQILDRTGCRPEWLELEISEDFIMRETKDAIRTLEQLRELGIRLAIDDFGTGYSSLSYLKRLPIHKLKIDRAFIRDLEKDPDDAAIVRAVTDLGKSLRLEIAAEGVESRFQENFLKSLSCDQAQGFLYGKPMPAARFEMLIRHKLAV